MKCKIAIFGGTFNPVHNGHIHLAMRFANLLGVEKVLLIPTKTPPHKIAVDLVSSEDRLAMCRLVSKNSIFEVSDIEVRRAGPSYTADTLKQLKLIYPDSEFYFITGEDMFLTIQSWYEPKVIYSLATLCAAPRSRDGLENLKRHAAILERYGAKTVIGNIDYLPISSTMVRDAVKQGKSITELVPAAVADYIMENNLYLESVQ